MCLDIFGLSDLMVGLKGQRFAYPTNQLSKSKIEVRSFLDCAANAGTQRQSLNAKSQGGRILSAHRPACHAN